MVLYKRKPVKFLPPPADIEDDDVEVWHIPQTGEIFVSYDEYLARMDFYKQARFNNQITGHSGMTFFDALKGELAGGQEVEAAFPEALKGPVLRKAQFQTVSRLDHLVDMIFDDFKADYFPGEAVLVSLDGTERKVPGLVRDKSSFGARTLPDGTKAKPLTRYTVDLQNIGEEHNAREEHVSRERGIFTKAMIRSFIKKTVSREAWNGAPWIVKPEYAQQYYIDSRVPPHLRYETKLMERKQMQAQKRATNPPETNGSTGGGPARLPDLKPAAKTHKAKGPHGSKGSKEDDTPSGSNNQDISRLAQQPTPPPPPKYPIDDLELPPRDLARPTLSFLCRNPPTTVLNGSTNGAVQSDRIEMASVGALLETWDTLNVYCEIFQLDSFTFDDFVEAMDVASKEIEVQLFEEIHCSVLKVLVDSEADGGRLRITLPQLDEEDSDEEDEEEEEEEKEATPEPEPKPAGRATRSSLAKLEAERLAAEAAKAEAAAEEEKLEAELQTRHRAEDLLEDYDWVDHLRQRDFANGGWQKIVVGLFHQLSKKERYEARCEELLLKLVPPREEPTRESVCINYAQLDINDRVKALQILCMLTMETKKVRGYMEECSETMTKYRKEKIDWQRKKKAAIEEVRQLHEQRRTLQPSETAPNSPKLENTDMEDSKLSMDDSQMDLDQQDTEDTGAENQRGGKRRKGKADKQRKEEQEKERHEREKTKEEDQGPKSSLTAAQTKQLNKVLKDIQKQEDIIKECEEEVAIIENDLREADCPRTRVLGKDRFWNRYYWFERNGMPYAGLPDSSTAFAGYANGCIWVQGPDELEREGYIDVSEELQNEYKDKFGITLPERKAQEEGSTSVYNACQWGYISEPQKVEALISWLDPRGHNELRLRKELVLYKDRIVKHMENRRIYLTEAPEDERKEKEKDEASLKRTSSRIKDKTPEPLNYRCLKWENSLALEELGYLHSQPPPPPRSRKQTKKREAMAETAAPPSKKAKKK